MFTPRSFGKVGVEAYAAYALRAWLARDRSISGRRMVRRVVAGRVAPARWVCALALPPGRVRGHAPPGAARSAPLISRVHVKSLYPGYEHGRRMEQVSKSRLVAVVVFAAIRQAFAPQS